jgi:YHS domain-containing protein
MKLLLIILSSFIFLQTTQEPKKLEKDGIDPVCLMKVKKGTNLVSIHKGKEYGFCSKMCQEQFDKKPKKFIK